MIKYVKSMVTFEELPTEVTLSLSISNCQNRCPGCHSAELRANIGTQLTDNSLDDLITKNNGVSAVLFLGEGNDKDELIKLAEHVRKHWKLRVALYSGREDVENDIWNTFDYIKVGGYKSEFGPLTNVNTNQRLYRIENGNRKDITHMFWKDGR